ncbi:TetR/AcrR family transcriptional regulator [candidate division CSSED10-310 bacterium]|uniref:TetR/AcrR family transcriptional regulator n=1 Tax=candidate division CSSED10-310 bacterium TaxID=2855610 RepID=A0ABV6YUX7_UNCC1
MDRRQEIIQTASKLFLTRGYENTSLNEIAKKTSITKGGIYHYFESKEHLLTAVINNVFDGIARYSESYFKDCQTPKEFFKMLFTSVEAMKGSSSEIFGESNPSVSGNFLPFFLSMAKKYPFVKKKTRVFAREIRTYFMKMFEELKDKGQLRNDIDIEAMSFEVHALMEGFFIISSLDDSLNMKDIGNRVFENMWKRIER